MTTQHSTIQSADCHEPKHITDATMSESGKVLTPSNSSDGVSVLRYLTLSDITAGELTDAELTIVDNSDTTKKMVFQLSGITAANTRTLTVPDSDGTLVLLALAQTLTNKRITPRVVVLTDAANIAVNSDTTDIGTVTITASRTLANPTGTPTDGQRLRIRVRQDGTGTWTLSYDTKYRFSGASAPTVTATAAKTSYLDFMYHSSDDKWDCVATALDY